LVEAEKSAADDIFDKRLLPLAAPEIFFGNFKLSQCPQKVSIFLSKIKTAEDVPWINGNRAKTLIS
jgi:hypothetical protein